ncbi:MAG: glutamate--tRNA ligase [Acidobacteriota bacterium]
MTDHTLAGPVRVRFAPSPTGYLHVGGARTAIYNELLRLNAGGAFILRIEDTDRERSDEAMTRQICSALEWLGLRWDEGPFLQSERVDRHREAAAELIANGKAYRCFCSLELLDEQRKAAEAKGDAFFYPRTCFAVARGDSDARAAAGETFAVRFRMPGEVIRFQDLVRGAMEFPRDAVDDFILLRSDGSPTYHLSVCVDDVDMRISHVIRGEDHLTNTAKHVPLFQALGSPVPMFAHLPLILGTDKKRLSKRFGAASVEEFREQGILPEALYNYLALLGWSPGHDREVLSREEMGRLFTTDRLNSSPAIFDHEKLAWMNGQYISHLPLAELLEHAASFLAAEGLAGVEKARLGAAVDLHKNRARSLGHLAQMVRPYFEPIAYDEEACKEFVSDPSVAESMAFLRVRFVAVDPFGKDGVEAALRALATERGVKAGVLIHPARMALSGVAVGPPLFDLVALMGRQATEEHMLRFEGFLRAAGAAQGSTGPTAK